MQVTSPLLNLNSLKKGLDFYKENSSSNYLTVFSAYEYKQFTWMFEKDNCIPISYDPFERKSTQNMKSSFNETGGFYIFPIKGFLFFKNRFMKNCLPLKVDLLESLDIDDNSDLKIARKIFDRF